MLDENAIGRIKAGTEREAQVLSVILDRAIQHLDQNGYSAGQQYQQYFDLLCCKIIFEREPCLTSLKKRLGLFGFLELIEYLLEIEWGHQDLFLKAYLELIEDNLHTDKFALAS